MEEKIQRNRQQHLVLVPCPYQGHINPMLQLGKALQSNYGFSITIAHTIYNSPDPRNHLGFAFYPMPEGLPDRNHAAAEYLLEDLLAMNHNCKSTFKSFLKENVDTISCVISDELMFFAEEVTVDLKLPSVILRTSSAATALARSAIIELTQGGHISLQGHASYELVPENHPLRFKDLPFSVSPDFGSFSLLIAKAYINRVCSAIIWNTANCIEQAVLDTIRRRSQVPIFAIGPVHMLAPPLSSSLIDEDRDCISWLNKQPQNSVVYVSCLGSIATISEQEAAEIAWGLASSQHPFLWVIRPGSIRGSDWIELLPRGFSGDVADRGCVVKWAPQKEVLAHGSVGVFWSHCGWNSSLESMAAGVPMICRPCFGDQRVNARYMSHVWRVGVELEDLERGEIERAIRRVMSNVDQGKEIRSRALELKKEFEVSTTIGGSSYDSFNELVSFIKSL